MSFMVPKRSTILFILILVSLASVAFGGRQPKLSDESKAQVGALSEEPPRKIVHDEQAFKVHPRILKVQTNDYGSYDPAPALVKPPFKLIPN